MSRSSCYQLGVHILNMLEQIHAAGYVYNDLKLDNLMVNLQCELPIDARRNVFKNMPLNIVDFGFATKYLQCVIDSEDKK